MQRTTGFLTVLTAALVLTSGGQSGHAADGTQAFRRGYYLQMHEQDPKAAIDAFEAALDDPDLPEELKHETRTRLVACREDLRAADMANLMPPEVIGYVEIQKPGPHLMRIAEMLSILPSDEGDAAVTESMPLAPGLAVPGRPTISPALLEAIGEIHGVAFAVTSFDPRRGPGGVMVIHPGESKLLRGVLESSVQLAESIEHPRGDRMWRFQNQAWIAQTARLFLVASTQTELEAALGRLRGEGENLAEQPAFRKHRERRNETVFFGYVNGPAIRQQVVGMLRGEELQILNGLVDLQHLESCTLAIGTTEAGPHARLQVDLREGHNNLVYGLVRTAALTGRSLDAVPAGTPAVAVLGLNPATDRSPGDEQPKPPAQITAMDIGRELFGNIEELALFLQPGGQASGPVPIPDAGLIIVSQNARTSERLWNQLLALPTLFFAPHVQGPVDVQIGDLTAQEYRFPAGPPVVVTRLGESGMVVGTQAAVQAAVEASTSGASIRTDEAFHTLTERLSETSSKALLVDVGRVMQEVARLAPPQAARELPLIAGMFEGLQVSLITEETANSLAVRLEATGLPDVPRIVATIGRMQATRSTPHRIIIRSEAATTDDVKVEVREVPPTPPAAQQKER